MNGWIVYNDSLKIKKITDLVFSLAKDGENLGVNLKPIKNIDLIPAVNENGEAIIIKKEKLDNPDFVIFWDKDVLLAKHFEKMGIKVYNSAKSIEYCDHKGLMHSKLANTGIKMPKTILSHLIFNNYDLSEDYIRQVCHYLGNEIILKECKGSFGMQVYKYDDYKLLGEKIRELYNEKKDFILQENVSTSYGRDIRVNIIGNKVIGAMYRENATDFRANITNGGVGKVVELTKEQEEIALKAHKALGLTFSGVDLLFGHNDEPLICEVNSNVNYLSFEAVWGKGFGVEIIKHIIGVCYA